MCRMIMVSSFGNAKLDGPMIQKSLEYTQKMASGEKGYMIEKVTNLAPISGVMHHNDGHGLFVLGKGKYDERNEIDIHKVAFDEFKEKLPDDPYLLAFHARLKSDGELIKDNLQPFDRKDLVGMHNGTVFGLPKSNEKKSDSRYIYKKISEYLVANDHLIEPRSFENMLITDIVEKSKRFDSMNLSFYVPKSDRIVLLCSYDPKNGGLSDRIPYLTMSVAYNKNFLVAASEDHDFKIIESSTKRDMGNNSLMVFNRETGELEIDEKLQALEEAIQNKVRVTALEGKVLEDA